MDNVAHNSESRDKISSVTDTIKGLFSTDPQERSTRMGVRAVFASTALRRLPPPLNMLAPVLAEKLVMKYGVEEGRDLLLKGLRWVKKVTDEKPEVAV